MLPDTDVLPITPPYKHRSASDDAAAAFGSVYSTPADSDAMHSANLQCQEIYGGDTLDFRQVRLLLVMAVLSQPPTTCCWTVCIYCIIEHWQVLVFNFDMSSNLSMY